MILPPPAENETFNTNPMARPPARAPVPVSRRAKQFVPYDALKGFSEAISEAERIPEIRRFLEEDALEELRIKLSNLRKGDLVTVT